MFLAEAVKQVRAAGYRICNVDSTLILAAPKIVPHAKAIQKRIAELLGIQANDVGVKAKTPEGMGTDNAAIAHAVVLLGKRNHKRGKRTKAAAIPQQEMDKVAKQVIAQAAPLAKKSSR